jgi:DinB superfamily
MQDIIHMLEATPGILRSMLGDLTEEEGRWKPSPARWSITEVLGHLAHVESRGFRGRVERIGREDNPLLESYEPAGFAAAGVYAARGLPDALAEFERERSISVALLRSLPLEVLGRPGVHEKLGPLVAANVLNEWPFHDLGHIRQVAELVRSIRFYPNLGPWQKFYTIHP